MFARIAIATALVTAAFATTACSKDGGGGASCDKVVDHTVELAGLELSGEERGAALAKCEQQPAKVRECALAAKDILSLASCKP